MAILYYFVGSTGVIFSQMLGSIVLPMGYILIIGGILIAIAVSHFFIERDETGRSIQDIFVMFLIYGFLFLISAFGIVWYGVFVYFLCLTLIGLASLAFTSHTAHDDEDIMGMKVTLSFLFFLFILVYIIRSAFPHGWNNLV
jgi:hypothetical protein